MTENTYKTFAEMASSEEPDMEKMTCPDCDGDSDPIDDLYYCSQCRGIGWIYSQQIESPYLDHYDIQRWNRLYQESQKP